MRTNWGMAAVTLGLLLPCASAHSQDPPPDSAEHPGVTNRVQLVLQISGLSSEGCQVEIRPAHPGCRFKTVVGKVPGVPRGKVAKLDPINIDATSIGADRDCSFSITLREPGLEPRTFLRGLRLDTPDAEHPVPARSLRCYLNSASIASNLDSDTKRR